MKRIRIETTLVVIACGLASLAGACADREHIRDDYGQHVRAFQNRQRVYAQAAVGAPTGLDSEESAVIHKSYTTGLSGKAGTATQNDSRVLILGDPNRAAPKE